MKFKKIMLITLLLLAVLTISSVSANDNLTDDELQLDSSDEIELSDDADIISSSQEDIITETDDGTFTALENKINAADEGSTITLENNYTYKGYMNVAITIDKSLTIEGNGRTIDGNSQTQIFFLEANNITIKNINFINCHSEGMGGAVQNYCGNNCIISSCTFINCDSSSGGAIYNDEGDNFTVDSCTFTYCSENDGVTIYNNIGANCSATNSKFTDLNENEAGHNVIFINCTFAYVPNTTYTNKTDDGSGGDSENEDDDGIIIYVDEEESFPTTGENVDDRFVCITIPNDSEASYISVNGAGEEYFMKNLTDFNENDTEYEDDYNTNYLISPLDVNFFEGLSDGDEVSIYVNSDDDALTSKSYLIYFDGESFRLEQNDDDDDDDDDGDDGVVIWVEDDNEFSLDDDLDEVFAIISIRNNLEGWVIIKSYDEEGEDIIFFNKTLENIEGEESEDYEDFTAYSITLNDIDNLEEFKNQERFKIGFYVDDDGELDKVDGREYNIDYDGDENVISFEEADEDKINYIWYNEDEISLTGDNDYNCSTEVFAIKNLEGTSYGIFIMKTEDEIIFNMTCGSKDDKNYDYYAHLSDLDLSKLNDGDVCRVIFYGSESDEDVYYKDFEVELTEDYIKFEFIDDGDDDDDVFGGPFMLRVFYGNSTSGETEEGMITLATEKFIDAGIPFEFIDGVLIINFENETITYSLKNNTNEDLSITTEYDEEIGVYTEAWIELSDDVRELLSRHSNENFTVTLSVEVDNETLPYIETLDNDGFSIISHIQDDGKTLILTDKRFIKDDFIYQIITASDLKYIFDFDIADDLITDCESTVVNISVFDSNMMFIQNDLSGAYFSVYVDDVKVKEGFAIKWDESGPYIDTELNLKELGISTSGTYNIKITHTPVYYPDDGEDEVINYTIYVEDEVLSKDILVGIDSNSTVEIADSITFNYGETGSAEFNLTGATGVNVTVFDETANVVDGVVSAEDGNIAISGLDAGTYTLLLTTIPENYFLTVNKTVKITVNKINSTVEIDNVELYYGNSVNVTAATEGASGITAKIDDDYADVSGNTIAISGLNAGNYTLTVTTLPDANHHAATAAAVISVNKAPTTITLDNTTLNLEIGDTATLAATIDPAGLNMTYVSSDESVASISNGNIVAVSAGSAVITVSFTGNDNYAAAEDKTVAVTVTQAETPSNETETNTTVTKVSTSLTASKVTATYAVSKKLTVTLKDADGNVLANKKITIKVGTISKTLNTDSNGQASVVVSGLVPKTYSATVKFAGDDNYTTSNKSVSVVVKKATPKITAKAKTFKKATKTKKYTITLKNNLKKVMKKAKVYIKVNGKTYSAKTNSKGKATFKITKLTKKGTFKSTITYKGNSYYNKVTKKVKIKVK